MKKRIGLALAIAFLAAALALAATAASPGPGGSGETDVVVLLDSSQSVLPYFQDVTDFVLSSVVRDFLRFGDTFHLLTFGDSTQTEIAQKMSDERDVKSVLGRLYLLYPLARHSDFLGALGYLRQYLMDLPESRRKVVVVITDGVQNSAPANPSASMDRAAIGAGIETECAAIRSNGWDLRLIKLPFAPKGAGATAAGASGAQASGAPGQQAAAAADGAGESYIDLAAAALGARVSEFDANTKESLARTSLSLPAVEYPSHLGKRGYAFSFPLKISNGSDAEIGLELEALALGPSDILARKSFLTLAPGKSGVMDLRVALPESIEPGELSLTVEPRFAGGVRVSPQSGSIALTLSRSPLASFFRSSLRLVLFALLLVIGLAAVLLVVLALRRVSRRAEAPIVDAVLDSASPRLSSTASSGAAAAARPEPARPEAVRTAKSRGAFAPGPQAAGSPAREAVAPSLEAPAPSLRLDEHEAAIAREAAEMAKSAQEDSVRAASVLAEAAARGSSTALDKIAAFKERRERERARAAAGKGPRAVPAAASRPLAGEPAVRRPGTLRVELKVEDQNPNIGMRNVRTIHAGQSKSVGGGRSDFLVFLVPTPRNAADLHFDGERLTLIPRRPELFPGVEGPIEDCLGQEILMLGKNGYPLVLTFSVYERPADRINRLLHCIETPGLVRDLDPSSR